MVDGLSWKTCFGATLAPSVRMEVQYREGVSAKLSLMLPPFGPKVPPLQGRKTMDRLAADHATSLPSNPFFVLSRIAGGSSYNPYRTVLFTL